MWPTSYVSLSRGAVVLVGALVVLLLLGWMIWPRFQRAPVATDEVSPARQTPGASMSASGNVVSTVSLPPALDRERRAEARQRSANEDDISALQRRVAELEASVARLAAPDPDSSVGEAPRAELAEQLAAEAVREEQRTADYKAELDDVFGGEEIDPVWSAETEDRVMELLAANDFLGDAQRYVSVECRATLCAVVTDHPQAGQMDRALMAARAQLPYGVMLRNPDGSTVFYLGREELPAPAIEQ